MNNFVRVASGAVVLGLLTAPVDTHFAFAQNVAGQATWSEAAPLTHARNEVVGAAVGGKFYTFGGFDGVAYESDRVEIYDPSTDEWSEGAPMLEGVNHAGITVLDGTIYLAGGFRVRQHRQEKASFIAFHPDTNQWERLPDMPGVKGAISLAGVDGKIHAIGGRRNNAVLDEHDVYNVATRQWTKAASLPTARDHAGVGVLDGKIHIIGGRLVETEENLPLHDVYDPASDSWSPAPPIPPARSAGAYAVHQGLLFYFGGECRLDGRNFNEAEAFDPVADAWRVFPNMPVPLHGQAAGAIGDHIYMASGSDPCGSGDRKTQNWVFTLR